MPKLLLQNALALVTMDDALAVHAPGWLTAEDGAVTATGAGRPPADAAAGADEVVDATDRVVLPGLVNTHHHLCQTLTRAFPGTTDAKLFDWLVRLYPVWANLTEDDVRSAARIGLAELLLSGCTTSSDHHYLFPRNAGSRLIDATIEAAGEVGVRFLATRGSMSLSEKDGGLPPDTVVQDTDTILADSERIVDAYHDRSPAARVRVGLAPCSPFTVTEDLLSKTAALARERGVRLHTHLAETHDEDDHAIAHFGCRPLELMERTGWLADDVWYAHGVHFQDGEIRRMGAKGVGVAHCPSSNMRLGSGTCRVGDLLAAGCPVSLGVDGSASNDTGHLLLEARMALLVRRLAAGADAMRTMDALALATRGGARTLGWPEIGSLEPGRRADFALFRMDEVGYSGAGDPVAALLLCGPGRAESVYVDGKAAVREGRVLGLDTAAAVADHRARARRLLYCAA